MRKTLRKNSGITQLLIIAQIINLPLLSGQTICETKSIDGVFAYEQSHYLWSEDDMIYRKASFVRVRNDSVNYMEGIYTFEYGVNVPKECLHEKNKMSVTYNTNSLNDSIHLFLEKRETSFLKKNGGTYKLFNLELQVMFLGYCSMKITNGKKFTNKEIPCYLILSFNKIDSLTK